MLFGFMDFLIIVKWLTDYSVMVGASPPSIITLMVAMFLEGGETTDTLLISAQVEIMNVFLVIALLCVPIMLFVKPILEYRQYKNEVLETPKVSL
jgi:V-type H+-transporting ATPase subunit a